MIISLFKDIFNVYESTSNPNNLKTNNQKHAIIQMKLNDLINRNEASLNLDASNKNSKAEFIEHPQDSYITKQFVYVKCSAKNTHTAYIECNNKINDYKSDNDSVIF